MQHDVIGNYTIIMFCLYSPRLHYSRNTVHQLTCTNPPYACFNLQHRKISGSSQELLILSHDSSHLILLHSLGEQITMSSLLILGMYSSSSSHCLYCTRSFEDRSNPKHDLISSPKENAEWSSTSCDKP